MKKYLLFVLLLSCITFNSLAQTSKIQKDIKKLLVLTGSAKLGKQVATQLMESFKTTYPSVPEEVWDGFIQEMDENEMIELIMPIYEKHYTHDDIKGLIKFYKTPLGKKTIQVLPQLTQDSMAIGQKWGMELAGRMLKKLQDGGYIEI